MKRFSNSDGMAPKGDGEPHYHTTEPMGQQTVNLHRTYNDDEWARAQRWEQFTPDKLKQCGRRLKEQKGQRMDGSRKAVKVYKATPL